MTDETGAGPTGPYQPGPSPGSADGEAAGLREGASLPPDSGAGDVTAETTSPEVTPSPAPPVSPPDAGRPPDDVALEESFLTIWLHPRATIRRINTGNPTYWVLPLAAIGGIAQVFASASRRDLPDITLGAVLVIALIGGPIFGVVALYLGAWLTRLTGRWWLHGQARPEELRAAYGWASLPHVVALPLWLLATAAFGEALYTQSGGELAALSPVYVLFTLAVLVLQVWSLVIASAGVAEAQGYRSGWKGFANILLVVLLVLAATLSVVLVLAFLVGLVAKLVS